MEAAGTFPLPTANPKTMRNVDPRCKNIIVKYAVCRQEKSSTKATASTFLVIATYEKGHMFNSHMSYYSCTCHMTSTTIFALA